MHEEIIARAGEIVAQNVLAGYCALALLDTDGYPTASTITPAKADGIKWVAFCTGFGPRTDRINLCNRASLCFNSMAYNITLTGTIEIVTDPAVKKEMWYDGLQNHFTGPEDPSFCVLLFKTERYNLLVDWKAARGEYHKK
jgi:general stress protein 26